MSALKLSDRPDEFLLESIAMPAVVDSRKSVERKAFA
jgi:hypothetical protein